jgi:hypothetical protein
MEFDVPDLSQNDDYRKVILINIFPRTLSQAERLLHQGNIRVGLMQPRHVFKAGSRQISILLFWISAVAPANWLKRFNQMYELNRLNLHICFAFMRLWD